MTITGIINSMSVSENNKQDGVSGIFKKYVKYGGMDNDLSLVLDTKPGIKLTTPPMIDMDFNDVVRGDNGIWSRGAYQKRLNDTGDSSDPIPPNYLSPPRNLVVSY